MNYEERNVILLDEIRDFREQNKHLNLGIEHDIGVVLYNFILKHNIKTIVETGICYGFSSWYFLSALEKTGGKLWSIESRPKNAEDIVVPKKLRSNWKWYDGVCPQKLHQLLLKLKHIDLFWHDSNHDFGIQFGEYIFASKHCTYLGSHDISRSGAWEAFIPLFGWKELIHKTKYGIAIKDGTR